MNDLDLLSMDLEDYLENGFFLDDGRLAQYVKKQYVTKIKDLKIEIFTREHLPPHFHVISASRGINAKFSIPEIEYMGDVKGGKSISEKDMRIVQTYFFQHPEKLTKLFALGDKVFKDMKL